MTELPSTMSISNRGRMGAYWQFAHAPQTSWQPLSYMGHLHAIGMCVLMALSREMPHTIASAFDCVGASRRAGEGAQGVFGSLSYLRRESSTSIFPCY